MQMLNAIENLLEKVGGIDVANSIIADNIIEELASICMLHN